MSVIIYTPSLSSISVSLIIASLLLFINSKDQAIQFYLIQYRFFELAAGGIASGKGMLAAMVLGADGVQIGSRFVATEESSAHQNFKNMIIDAKDGDTHLTLKELAPVRLLKNKFYQEVQELYQQNPSKDQLKELLGRARAKKGMFEGDLEDGELEIGQIAGLIHNIKPAKIVLEEIIEEYNLSKELVYSDL